MRLKDKVAVITGASRGIGAQIAIMFVQEGAKVVLAARDLGEMLIVQEQIKKSKGDSLCIKTDMRNKDNVINMAKKAYNEFGSIDVLINNAGYPMFGYAIDDESDEVEERYTAIMETNLRGYWYAARFVIPYMKEKQKGSIINISSVRGNLGLANETAYCAAKGAVNMFTRSLAIEMAPFNIRVNTISPGAIQVKVGHWVLSRYGKDAYQKYIEKYKDVHLQIMKNTQPLHMIGKPEDVAYAAIYLASDEANFVTGSNLFIDGGLTSLLPEPGALDMDVLNEIYIKSKEMNEWFKGLE
jgi:NAD(P)-dependent dehydrogenase (short-subunit alcohol dehydrogenase family)